METLAAKHREEMMPATRAAETRNSEGAPQKREFSFAELGRDALHFKIAAIAAMGGEDKTDRNHPAVEAAFARSATPWTQTCGAEQVVQEAVAARTVAAVGMASGTNQGSAF